MITLEMMPPLMFGGLVLAMLIGFPVAFMLAAVGLSFGFLAIDLGFFDLNFLQSIPGRVFGSVLSNELLLAIPFFTFMGLVLERSGMAEDLLDTIGQLFGTVRGGLAYAVVFVGALLAATTGVVAASVISMGLISLPIIVLLVPSRTSRIPNGVIAVVVLLTRNGPVNEVTVTKGPRFAGARLSFAIVDSGMFCSKSELPQFTM